jgi:hypothetical protein
MKVLVSGYDHYGFVTAIARGFGSLPGCQANAFTHSYAPIRKLRKGPWIKRKWHGIKTRSLNDKLLKEARVGGYHLVLCIEGGCMLPETVTALGRVTRVALWCLDSIRHLDLEPEVMGSFSPLLYFEPTDRDFLPGGHYIPIGFDDHIYRRRADESICHDLIWVGSPHKDRLPRLEEIAAFSEKEGYDFGVYGYFYRKKSQEQDLRNNWPALCRAIRKNARIRPEEANRLYNTARIAVNLHLQDPVSQGINPRTFEAPGSGCFLLSDYKAGIEKMFEPEQEISLFRDMNEFKKKAIYFLKHEEKRQKMAFKAHEKAHAKHTFASRCSDILKLMEA